mmetsp:Transcript_65268/g.135154  ORF Transcript_65268/g.135154 Transcript_65268/m.135154 type:complete len:409 (-) Transcript_65268:87-1313(-)|eukprot:s255_g12.t1
MILSSAPSPFVQAAQLRRMLVVCFLLQWGSAVARPLVDAGCGAETCGNERSSSTFSSGDKVTDVQEWLCGFGEDGAVSLASVLWLDVQQVLEHSCGFVNNSKPVRFALVRTHKTGSTTVATTLMRSGMSLGLRWAGCDDNSRFVPHERACKARNYSSDSNLNEGKYDFEARHTYEFATWWTSEPFLGQCDADGRHFERTLMGYEEQMGSDVQVFVLIREAHSHLRSALDFFKVPFAKFNASESLWNPLAKDLRLLEVDHVEDFLSRWPFNRTGRLHVLVTEELAASMVIFRRKVNWSLRDVVFLSSRVTTKYSRIPDRASMPPGRLDWDERLNEVLRPLFMTELRRQSNDFQREVAALNRINSALPLVCAQAESQRGLLASVCNAKVDSMQAGRQQVLLYRKSYCGSE